ncbi:methylamine utilization protein [Tenacibaculum holothuriorum]|uniref:Methylamine utilization protein n=1 Tax=Tenacibaculum holothuriorum TaxID=1635173 RepID=A0A1Y2PEH8_9FLAO|nr:cytochrome c peroxidase [Tenacibaculum holothuriorum]OSY88197.1 methylamine utilization protein [Tenacibaculum holothuriorum]
MKKQTSFFKKAHVIMCLFAIVLCSCKNTSSSHYLPKTKDYVVALENDYKQGLEATINYLDSLKDSSNQRIFWYKKARKQFKKIEPVLAFTDSDNYKSLNAPNLLKIEEEDATDIKINKPFGFQVIEEMLLDDEVSKLDFNETVSATQKRLELILQNSKLYLKDYHVLWLIRDQIARTALTGITGFDSPVFEQSIEEAQIVYKSLIKLIKNYREKFNNIELYKEWLKELDSSVNDLQGNFNDFNRYEFIKKHAHPQLKLLQKTIKDWQVQFPLELAFKNNMTSLFSKETFNINYFSDYKMKKDSLFKEKISLGKQLFNDKRLSKNETMSCATCHIKELAFTDGKTTFDKQTRNTPTLSYVALQKSFFHDGRAGSLEGQIVGVVENKNEFHSDLKNLTEKIKKDSIYSQLIKSLYGKVNDMVIRNSIADYMRTLGEFNSKFDKNINGQEKTLSKAEIKGFNLFMGKAKCATCHFPPVFNGTVPPAFKDSELESIGVPNLQEDNLDEDLGRYHVFNTNERMYFFKTPTIRNIAKTAPYMHNGVYKSLNQVMDFYNKGGGEGLGFKVPNQTLPADKLELSKEEIQSLIAFMESLTDED